MSGPDQTQAPHRRKNILTGEWVLVSPQRTRRPWHGEISHPSRDRLDAYEPECYLCPGNKRSNGERNPSYKRPFVFTNDYAALLPETVPWKSRSHDLLIAQTERGVGRVVCFSPRHDLTLAAMSEKSIEDVVTVWQEEFRSLAADPRIKYVQIFENKGAMMGCSNPHPHGQIWAQESIPMMPMKERKEFRKYFRRKGGSLLGDYVALELQLQERVVYENRSFVIVVPYWAVWPFETLMISKRAMPDILQLRKVEKKDFANALSVMAIKYDNLFKTSFPYSAGLHQAPTDGGGHEGWHLHMHFYPPLLRSASIRKFMVGYEMLAEPQRDTTPEASAKILKDLPVIRFRDRRKTSSRA
ncbi:MAG: UDP-glucose--hexose-1-phosphate uridylyltransferase [Ignavibacteriales bacterium]|nr:UDP-glucose--hexose-1-phosphate uridylyltransferase [Ignavibacteriales bacterium]